MTSSFRVDLSIVVFSLYVCVIAKYMELERVWCDKKDPIQLLCDLFVSVAKTNDVPGCSTRYTNGRDSLVCKVCVNAICTSPSLSGEKGQDNTTVTGTVCDCVAVVWFLAIVVSTSIDFPPYSFAAWNQDIAGIFKSFKSTNRCWSRECHCN